MSGEVSHGISTALILYCVDSDSGRVIKQFHEVSTYHHGSNKHSTYDKKIILAWVTIYIQKSNSLMAK